MEEPLADARTRIGAIQVERVTLRWRAWSASLPNPRYGLTAASARRRVQSDLDFEWRTGRPRRWQRAPR